MRRATTELSVLALAVLFGSGASICSADVTVLQPTDDTYVDTRHPDDVYNQEPWCNFLYADYSYIGPHYRQSLLKFDLSSIPMGATIESASLLMYCVPSSDEHTYLYRTEHDGWDEDSTSWNSYEPYMSSGVLVADEDVYAAYPDEYWVEWNIDVDLWSPVADLNDDRVTFLLKGDTSDLNYTVGADFGSKEYLTVGGDPRIPHLVITWVPEPSSALALIALGSMAALYRRNRA